MHICDPCCAVPLSLGKASDAHDLRDSCCQGSADFGHQITHTYTHAINVLCPSGPTKHRTLCMDTWDRCRQCFIPLITHQRSTYSINALSLSNPTPTDGANGIVVLANILATRIPITSGKFTQTKYACNQELDPKITTSCQACTIPLQRGAPMTCWPMKL